jgi:hypothetical protein
MNNVLHSSRMRVVPALAAVLMLAACGSTQSIAPSVRQVSANASPAAGEVKFTLRNPNQEKWTAQIEQGANDGSVRTGFTCKVLVCPEPASVVVIRRVVRGARPDKAALDKIAKVNIPKLNEARNLELQVRSDNRAKVETVSSGTTRFGNYDAILSETKITVTDRSRFTSIAMILAGRMIVTISSEAGDRATARKAIDEFATNFTVEEGPPV